MAAVDEGADVEELREQVRLWREREGLLWEAAGRMGNDPELVRVAEQVGQERARWEDRLEAAVDEGDEVEDAGEPGG